MRRRVENTRPEQVAKIPKQDQKICVYEISGVEWPDRVHGFGVVGVVTDVTDQDFRFMPDLPDPTSNTDDPANDARHFDALGWHVQFTAVWHDWQYVIEEEPG